MASAEATRPRPSAGLVRYALASLWLAACFYLALVLAFGLGTYYMTDVGLDRLREKAFFLVLAVSVGVYGMSAFLLLTRRRVLSPWLVLGLAPAIVAALNHAGVIE